MYSDVQNFAIYGHTNYIMQYIADEFPGVIKFDRSKVRVHTFDIECCSGIDKYSEDHTIKIRKKQS